MRRPLIRCQPLIPPDLREKPRSPVNSDVRRMNSEAITLIRIDEKNRICITPKETDFQYIYRAAMEVHWDGSGKFLHSPVPREWSHLQWFKQIIGAARDEYGCQLLVTDQTAWENVPDTTKEEILKTMSPAAASNQP